MLQLQELELRNFRLFSHLCWQPAPQLNFIFGANGAGKSSILEGIYYLSRNTSFRAAKVDDVINHQAQPKQAVIRVLLQTEHADLPADSPLQRSERKISLSPTQARQVTIDGVLQTPQQLATKRLPLIFVAPHNANLVDAAPGIRRSFLDAILFYTNPEFTKVQKNYRQVLRQRNKLLLDIAKSHNQQELAYWDAELGKWGEVWESHRQELLVPLLAATQQILEKFQLAQVKIDYMRGWAEGRSLAEELRQQQSRDLRYGFTTCGCHRADFALLTAGRAVPKVFSLGQQKLLSLAFFLAAAKMLQARTQILPLLLLDDIVEQLDEANRDLLLAQLASEKNQVILTTTNAKNLVKYLGEREDSAWQLEQHKLLPR